MQNRPGAGTATAAREVAASPPDGYTIFSSSNSTFVLPHVLKDKLPYDSAKDFEPVAQIAEQRQRAAEQQRHDGQGAQQFDHRQAVPAAD